MGAVSAAAVLPVWVDFTISLKGLPCAPGLVMRASRGGQMKSCKPGPATTRRGISIVVGVTRFKLTISMCSLIR